MGSVVDSIASILRGISTSIDTDIPELFTAPEEKSDWNNKNGEEAIRGVTNIAAKEG